MWREWHAAATRGHSTRVLADGQEAGVTHAATHMHQLEPRCRAHINAPISVADVQGLRAAAATVWVQRRGTLPGFADTATSIPNEGRGLKNVARSRACNYGHVFWVAVGVGTVVVGPYRKVLTAHLPIWRQ
jgi:hypothetical protein